MKKNKKNITLLKQNWGKIKKDAFNFNLIEEYFLGKEIEDSPYVLSEKVASDIDFYDFFKTVDRTKSALGQQYLYEQLRRINTTQADLAELEKRIEFYQEEEKRVEVQQILKGLSTSNDYYFPFLMYGALPPKLKYFWAVQFGQMLAIALILTSFFKPIFVIPLVFVFLINLGVHYWHKNRIGNFAHIFSRLTRLVTTAKKLLPLSSESEVQQQIKSIESITAKVLVLKTNTLQESEFAAFLWYVIELIKSATLIEVTTFHSVVDKIENSRKDIEALFEFIAKIDMAISTASFRASLPYYSLPNFTPAKKEMKIEGVIHILVNNCVDNSLHLKNKSLLLTGSNMSGKSTFIKAINLNVISSQVLNTSLTKRYEAPILAIATSIRISDDITEEKSYYMEEVQSMGELIEHSKNEAIQYLFTIDEVFKGTNTIERISAAKAILDYLNNDKKHLVLVSTHDIELTQLLENHYELHYFQEKIENETLSFDYKLRQGALEKRNAINILDLAGYPKEIIMEAKRLATEFEREKTGN